MDKLEKLYQRGRNNLVEDLSEQGATGEIVVEVGGNGERSDSEKKNIDILSDLILNPEKRPTAMIDYISALTGYSKTALNDLPISGYLKDVYSKRIEDLRLIFKADRENVEVISEMEELAREILANKKD